MEKTVIKPGIVLIKKDGIIYEVNKRTFQEIRAIIFDIDCNLCKLCENTACKSSKQIDDSFIIDALTLKSKDNCDYVFQCEKFDENQQDYTTKKLVWFSPSTEEMCDEEKTIRHYNEAHVRHLVHPTVRKHIDKIK